MTRETSAEIASIAARLMGMSPQAMAEAHASEGKEFAEQVRRVAASALGQREEEEPPTPAREEEITGIAPEGLRVPCP